MVQSLLSRARGCVLLSCDTLVTGHQQLGWIPLACTGHGRQIVGILGVASANCLKPHLFFFFDDLLQGGVVGFNCHAPTEQVINANVYKPYVMAKHSRSIFEYLDSASVRDRDAMATMRSFP